ncbi:hypothetical protein ACFQVA_31660 [Actinomadura keratinilytica]
MALSTILMIVCVVSLLLLERVRPLSRGAGTARALDRTGAF